MLSDPAGEGHKAAKERVRQEKLAKVAKVIGLSKLKSKYESHEAKRNLCAQYDMFLADDRIIPLLPKLIGGPSRRIIKAADSLALLDGSGL